MFILEKVFYDPHFIYFRWLIWLVWVVEVVIVIKYRKLLLRNIAIIILVSLGSLTISVPWDFFAINNGVWFFPNSLIGVWMLGVPLEEYMFFVSVASLIALITLVTAAREDKQLG